jgi:hypothetical protein
MNCLMMKVTYRFRLAPHSLAKRLACASPREAACGRRAREGTAGIREALLARIAGSPDAEGNAPDNQRADRVMNFGWYSSIDACACCLLLSVEQTARITRE